MAQDSSESWAIFVCARGIYQCLEFISNGGGDKFQAPDKGVSPFLQGEDLTKWEKKIRKKNLESNQQFSKTRDRFYQVNLGRIMSAFGVILGIFTSTQLVC